MKLLLVNYEYPPLGGGGGVAHRDIAEALARRHEVTVLTTHFRGLPRDERQRGVRVIRVPVWGRAEMPTATLRSMVTFAPAAVVAGLRLLRRSRPDLIHAFFAVPSGLPAVLLGRVRGIPVVLTLIGADIFDPSPTAGVATHQHPAVRAVVRFVIAHADAVTAISEDTRRRAQEYHRASSAIEVIPLGLVSPPHGAVAAHQSPPPWRLVAVGRLIPRKAYADLLRAIATLRRSDIQLHLVGDGPLSQDLRELATQLDIPHLVTFEGAVAEERKWELLSAADLFVSSSLYEGFGIVFLEAMHAGLPIVCTDVGGQTDFLLTGENALLVPPRKPAQLAAAIRQILDDPSLRQRLSAANRQKAQELLIHQTVARYEALFARVRDRSRSRAAPRVP